MNRIILESSPLYILICATLSIGLSLLMYRTKTPWSKKINRLLFSFRAFLIFFLALLLLEPIVKQVKNIFEKPAVIILQDNSTSVTAVVDSIQFLAINDQLQKLEDELQEKGLEVELRKLNNEQSTSDFTKAFRTISADYENKKIANVVFVSDGIYNEGVSPLYATFNFPIHTIAVGDTIARMDIAIRNIVYNKIAYEGNRFPITIELSAEGFLNEDVEVLLLHRNKTVERKNIRITNESLTKVEFQPFANERGIQRFEIVITPRNTEFNSSNNMATAFVEVVSGKKKILAIANAPHPDIKALRSVIDKNSNYDFNLYIPGVVELNVSKLQAEADLIILFQIPDIGGRNKSLLQQILQTNIPIFFVFGEQTDWQEVARQGLIQIENVPRQFDDATPSLNSTFNIFTISEEVPNIFTSLPPASVPFVKMQISPSATSLLFQKIGNVVTEKPLLFLDVIEDRKVAVMLGEGLWRWQLHEYGRSENTEAFDEVFSKLLQYMSTNDDRRKFKCYPTLQQFTDTQPVVFESQVYNDIFEPIFGNTIEIKLTDEAGKRSDYRYTTSLGNSQYTIGGLTEGVYRYEASTLLKEKEVVKGEFLVMKQQIELQNLTADFNFLRKLSAQTGGSFYKNNQIEKLKNMLTKTEANAIIHTEEKYDPFVNLKWIFFLLVLLVSTEWFLRKYHGGY